MPIPNNVSTATIIGDFRDFTGAADTGTITLRPNVSHVVVAGSPAVALNQSPIAINVSGPFSVQVPATDDADLTPRNWLYRVEIDLRHRKTVLFVAAPSGATVDLAKAVSAVPQRELLTPVRSVNGVGPDASGNIALALSSGGSPEDPGDYVTDAELVTALATKAALSHTHTKDQAGLSNVDNTADLAKPISTATQAALDTKSARLVVRPVRITSGNITLPNTSGGWQALAGLEVQLPASEGHWVEIGAHGMRSDASNAFLDLAVIVGSQLVRYLSTGTSTPLVEGDPAWYADPSAEYPNLTTPRGFVVESSDLDSGQVRFVVAAKANGLGTMYASTDFPFYMCAKNFGVVS
ncbi:hypothetical protein [Saccharothrix sp. HUAS TT1]|uniref:hypothetical protein n=1 Tax=unclassified Saccharothrix TaxID=2593673 RepID=UPI00345B91D7